MEKEHSLTTLVEHFENLIREIDFLLIRYEKQKAQKLSETKELLNSHDPLMNAEQPPMVLFTSLLSAFRRVHTVEQLRKLRYELAQIHTGTVLKLDNLTCAWQPGM